MRLNRLFAELHVGAGGRIRILLGLRGLGHLGAKHTLTAQFLSNVFWDKLAVALTVGLPEGGWAGWAHTTD